MKPLLAPARPPDAKLLSTHALGISGVFLSNDYEEFEHSRQRLLNQLGQITSAIRLDLEECLDNRGADSLRTYVLASDDVNAGRVSFASNPYGETQWTSVTAMLFWQSLPSPIEEVVDAIDGLWERATWSVLYAYDEDDFTLQNVRSMPGMEMYGIDAEQVELVSAIGGVVREIDTRANPGYFLNQEGLFWSVQWLNYWNAETQLRMFGQLLRQLPEGMQAKRLGEGAIRVRLSDRPGHFDDVCFHEQQLMFRQCVPFLYTANPYRAMGPETNGPA